MHYDMDYSALSGDEKRATAIQDIRDYMGERFELANINLANLRNQPEGVPSLEKFRLIVAFAGVQGYPAQAWYETLYPEHKQHSDTLDILPLTFLCDSCGQRFAESQSAITCPHCGGYEYSPVR